MTPKQMARELVETCLTYVVDASEVENDTVALMERMLFHHIDVARLDAARAMQERCAKRVDEAARTAKKMFDRATVGSSARSLRKSEYEALLSLAFAIRALNPEEEQKCTSPTAPTSAAT